MLVAITKKCCLPEYSFNPDFRRHCNIFFKRGDIIRFKSNNDYHYAIVNSIVPSGLNITDLIIKYNNEQLYFHKSNHINPKHKGMVNFSRKIYLCSNANLIFTN